MLTLVDVVDAEECAGECGGLAEGYKKALMNLSLWVDKNAAKEEDKTSDREERSGKELYEVFAFHGKSVFKIRCKYIPKKGRFANFRPFFVKNSSKTAI